MGNRQLYLQKKLNGYEFIVQDFDEKRISVHEEYMFKEAAIVILYPDGSIDALPIVKGIKWHLDYYKKLITLSPKFARIVKHFPNGWMDEYNTIKNNKIMTKMGLVVIQNMDIKVLPEEYKDREDFYSSFLFYGENKLTNELCYNLNLIFDNYPNEQLVSNIKRKPNRLDNENNKRKR